MVEWFQRATFEAPIMEWLGPTIGAVSAGFAVVVGLEIYLTPSGERYLQDHHQGSAAL